MAKRQVVSVDLDDEATPLERLGDTTLADVEEALRESFEELPVTAEVEVA